MNKVLIVNGGCLTDSFLTEQYHAFAPDCVIAVDGALEAFDRTGLWLSHIVGDFDTVNKDVLARYLKAGEHGRIAIERHMPRKDETDAELAMQLALSLQPSEILVLGATGNRMDHTLANLELLYLPFEKGVPCSIADEENRIMLIEHRAVFTPDERWKYISFLPFTDEVSGITLTGFSYPLFGYRMVRGHRPGLCVSNEITAPTAEITIERGIVYCVRSSDRIKETI